MSTQRQTTASQASAGSSTEQDVRKFERRLIEAAVQRDAETLDRLYADDFIFTGSLGEVLNKEQAIASYRAGEIRYESVETDEVDVRLYGDTAVSVGRATIKAHYRGQDFSGPYRYTAVYVKRESGWQEVAFHSSRIAQQ